MNQQPQPVQLTTQTAKAARGKQKMYAIQKMELYDKEQVPAGKLIITAYPNRYLPHSPKLDAQHWYKVIPADIE